MSHEVETMAYANEVPWHGLGFPVSNDLTPEQMLVEAGCDWNVSKHPIYADVNGTKVSADSFALVRDSDNKILSIVGEGWEPCQNKDAFEFFKDFVLAGEMSMETAGSLKGGKNVWALAKTNDSFDLFNGDQVNNYLLFSNPHEYGQSIVVQATPIRVVCNNTLTLSVTQNFDKQVRVNHRRVFDAEEVKKTLGIASKKLQKYKETAEFLGSVEFSDETLREYFKELFPSSKKGKLSYTAKKLTEIVEEQPGTEFAPNSWWQAYNSVSYLTDHVLGRSEDTRLQSAWFGQNQKKKIKALEKAVEFANAA